VEDLWLLRAAATCDNGKAAAAVVAAVASGAVGMVLEDEKRLLPLPGDGASSCSCWQLALLVTFFCRHFLFRNFVAFVPFPFPPTIQGMPKRLKERLQ
jgi:hypothetical protein